MLQKLSRYCFFAFILLLPIQTVWLWRVPMINGEKWQYGTIGLYGTDIFLLFAILLSVTPHLMRGPGFVFFHSNQPGSRVKPGMTQWGGGIFILWAGLSAFWAEDKVLAGYFFAKLLLMGGLFWLVGSRIILKPKGSILSHWLPIGVVAVAILESLLGIGQFLMQTTFASKWLGMSGYEPWQPGVSVLKNEFGRWLRAYGTFPHPNIFGAYLGVIFTALVSWIVIPDPIGDPGVKRRRLIILSVLPIILLALIISFSRTAWLGVFLALSALIASVLWRSKAESVIVISQRAEKKSLGKAMGIVLITAIIFAGVLHETIFPRFESAVIENEGSIVDRAALLHQASEIIREHPLLGVGAGNYTLAVMRLYPGIPIWNIQPVHNVFVLIFAELGAVGGAIFVMLFLLTLTQIFKTLFIGKWQKEKAIAGIAFLTLLPSLFLDHFLWDSHFGLMGLFLLFGLTFASGHVRKHYDIPPQEKKRGTSWH